MEIERLSKRRREVLANLAAGKSEKEIAERLAIQPSTVHAHVRRIYQQYGVHSRSQLLSLWVHLPSGADVAARL